MEIIIISAVIIGGIGLVIGLLHRTYRKEICG